MTQLDPTGPVLDERFIPADHDPLIVSSLLFDEVAQRRESGYNVDDVVRAANAMETNDVNGILRLVDGMRDAPRKGSWPWEEPESLDDIAAAITIPAARPVDSATLADRIHGGWLGRIAGCNMGKPIEWGDHWTPEHIRDYLETAGAYPMRDYLPLLDPMPKRFDLNASWVDSVRERINGGARDDDVDYALFGLHLLETRGSDFVTADVGQLWTELLPLRQTFTAERAAYINLARGLEFPETARFRNPYREWIGAQIRADIFGYVKPGDPWSAARLAYRDATLSHTANGVYGEMWAAALVSCAFCADDARDAIEWSSQVIPPNSRLASAIRHVLQLHSSGVSWETAMRAIREEYGQYCWVHTINNAALVSLGLLSGAGDYAASVGQTIMGGWDTDSNGATAGSVAGVLAGTSGIPAYLSDPLHDRTRSALFGFDNARISDLAARTLQLAGNLPAPRH